MKSSEVKFIVTGSMRSGTTFMAALLNSQNDMFCLEDFPWHFIPTKFSSREEFLCFSNAIDAKFIYLGLPAPRIAKNLDTNNDIHNYYIKHLKNIFSATKYGFKRTLLRKNELKALVDSGYKIIIVQRPTEDILKSWITRIEPDLDNACVRLQNFLKEINFYDPDLPYESYIVVQFEELTNDIEATLERISCFLGTELKNVECLFHSFNKNRFEFEKNTSFNLSEKPMYVDQFHKKTKSTELKKSASLVDNGIYRSSVKKSIKRKLKSFITSR